MERRIILAAGHGGGDVGATGQGTNEAAECIQIVNRAADKLRADGRFDVIVVPHELNLVDEINWINARYKSLNSGLCLEIHKNATVNAHGIESWYYGGDAQSQAIAQKLLNGIMSVPGMPVSRGTKPDTSNRYGRLGWVRDTTPWAILLEMGFVSDGGDPVDDAADDRYAEGVYRGVLQVFGLPTQAAPTPVPVTPLPTASMPKYSVFDSAGKQLGAYNSEDGAWNKYVTGGAKIVLTETGADVTGADVTGDFVTKYRPTVPAPTEPQPNPHPEYDPAKDEEQDKRLGAIEAIIKKITDFLSSIFSGWGK